MLLKQCRLLVNINIKGVSALLLKQNDGIKRTSFLHSAWSLTTKRLQREKMGCCHSETVSQMVFTKERKLWVDESSVYKVDVTTVHCGYIMCAQRIKNSGVR